MSGIFRKSILGILALILSCSTVDPKNSYTDFKFSSSSKKPTTFKSKKRIAVQTFIDERENDNISYSGLLLIPLVPYANEYFNKPELVDNFKINFLLEIESAKAMKTELESYSVFQKVFDTDRTFPKDADYLIRVRVKKNQIYNKETMYGINTLALQYYYFVLFMLDTDYYRAKADFELEIIDLKTNQTAFKKKFVRELSHFQSGISKKRIIGQSFLSFNERIIQTMSEEIIQYFEENKK